MKKFQYKFQRVLEYKGNIEEMRKGEYGSAKKELEEEEKRLNDIVQYKMKIFKQKNEIVAQAKIGDLKLYSTFMNTINEKINKQRVIVNEKQKEVKEKKNILIEAVKERKILEKLKEQDYNEYLYLAKKQEEKMIDEIVTFNNNIT